MPGIKKSSGNCISDTLMDEKGLILIEIVIGLAFAGFLLLGLTLIFTTGRDTYLHSRNYTQALYLAETKIEETSLFPLKTLNTNASQTEKMNGIFYTWTRQIQPVDSNSSLQQIQVNVKWKEHDGLHQAKLITLGRVNP